jgi:predicted ATPase
MMKLKHVKINKYKCITSEQEFQVNDEITILVGKNESGKTAILETIAKTNYFTSDTTFTFNKTLDYPRSELKAYEKSGKVGNVVTCTYELSDDLRSEIAEDVGEGFLTSKGIEVITNYDNKRTVAGIKTEESKFYKHQFAKHGITETEFKKSIIKSASISDLTQLANTALDEQCKKFIESLKPYFVNEWKWPKPLEEYVARKWLMPRLPKFLYYSEYYSLPSRIDLIRLRDKQIEDEGAAKTAQALFKLAEINLQELISATDFEAFIAELEATGNEITKQVFEYWKTNTDLIIKFMIDKKQQGHAQIPILDIRVEDRRHMVSLPLQSRSKGFNWFVSFIVWFSMIQEDPNSDYIVLLDEPGLNLHASAQADLLRFIEKLSENYQIVYTTHSPFMIETEHLDRVRTIVDTGKGAKISESIEEDDPDTLFPLQAALGYDIAQNLFISKNNLLVEGVGDLIYLIVMSDILQSAKQQGLKEGVTIVPVGGLDKVATFISLLKGSKLNVGCFLDSFKDQKGKQRLDDLVKKKIINEKNIHFAHEFCDVKIADIEDLFAKDDYLKLFNAAFPEYKDLRVTGFKDISIPIIPGISEMLGIDHFNHYRPARELAQRGVGSDFFNKESLSNFEKAFKALNKLF